jgi:excisionase family DNA binding protein
VTPTSSSVTAGGAGEIIPEDSGDLIRHPAKASSTERSRLLDIEALASWLGTTPRHIRRLVTERRVPFVKVGHFIRFDPRDIACWIEEQKVLADANEPRT